VGDASLVERPALGLVTGAAVEAFGLDLGMEFSPGATGTGGGGLEQAQKGGAHPGPSGLGGHRHPTDAGQVPLSRPTGRTDHHSARADQQAGVVQSDGMDGHVVKLVTL